MNYEGISHQPSEDEDWGFCNRCWVILTFQEYRESASRRYEEPICQKCMDKDEVKLNHMIDEYIGGSNE